MTINKIIEEINTRINYLEEKKKGLTILEITSQEQEKRRDKINEELYKLYSMKNCK